MYPEHGSSNSISLDTVFDLLADRRRRRVLDALREHGTLTLADVADEVARHENDAPLTDVPDDDVLRIYLSLYHSHIPKLAAQDVVAYDQDRDMVALAENADAVARHSATEDGEVA